MKSEYLQTRNRIEAKLRLYFVRFYIAGFNLYSFYWLYKLTFVSGYDWEDWLLWFFACMGVNAYFWDNSQKLLLRGSKDFEKAP